MYCCCCRCILHLQQYSRRLNLFFFSALDGNEMSMLTGLHCQSEHPNCKRKVPYRYQELNARKGPSQIVILTETSQLSTFRCKRNCCTETNLCPVVHVSETGTCAYRKLISFVIVVMVVVVVVVIIIIIIIKTTIGFGTVKFIFFAQVSNLTGRIYRFRLIVTFLYFVP